MTIDETIQKLIDLKLHTLAKGFREMLDMPPDKHLSFEDKLGLLVDREWADRDDRRIARRVKEARLSVRAAPEEVICDPARGLERALLRELSSGQWVRSHHNLIIVGPTGVGKSFLANALAQSAIRQSFRALFVRVPRLLEQLAIARASADYSATLERIAKIDVLILDDFLLAPMTDVERRDLLEVLEDRYGKTSTVLTSQLPTKNLARSTRRADYCGRHLRPPRAQRPRAHAPRCLRPTSERPQGSTSDRPRHLTRPALVTSFRSPIGCPEC